jgi:sensor histidine kinase YesM
VSGYSGIGLENVRKRLTLLFPGTHDLKIDKSDVDFKVLLQIKFK